MINYDDDTFANIDRLTNICYRHTHLQSLTKQHKATNTTHTHAINNYDIINIML